MGKLEVKGDELASSTPKPPEHMGIEFVYSLCFISFHFIKLYKAGPAIIGEAPSLFKNLINRKQAFNSFLNPDPGAQHIGELYSVIQWLARELTNSPRSRGR